MLLSAGCDPRDEEFDVKVKSQVRKWILAIDCAKNCPKKIFDNEMLEQKIIVFVFNEDFLRIALHS